MRQPDDHDTAEEIAWRKAQEEAAPLADTPKTDAIRDEHRGPWNEVGENLCRAMIRHANEMERENAKLKADLQNAWVKCQAVMMDLLDRGETWDSMIEWVEDRRDELDPQKVGNLSNAEISESEPAK